jgi:hypothetical protein
MNPILKKLIRDYNYLNETLDDVKEISSVAEGEFRNAMLESDPEAVEALMPKPKIDIEIKEEDIEIIEEVNNNHNDPKFKKLFRKIAVKCHPDKLRDINSSETKFLKKVYEDLNDANSKHDWGMLLKLAMELDIEFDELGEDEISNISENISIIKGDIARYENSMAYSWYIKNDENSKKEYLAICADIFKKSLNRD